jgi:hypothetical protein
MSSQGLRRSERIASIAPQASTRLEQQPSQIPAQRPATRKRKLSAIPDSSDDEEEDQDFNDRATMSPARRGASRMPDLQTLLDHHRRMRREQDQLRSFDVMEEGVLEDESNSENEDSKVDISEDEDDSTAINPRVRRTTPLAELTDYIATEQQRRNAHEAAAQAEHDARAEALRALAEAPIKRDPEATPRPSHAGVNEATNESVNIKQEDVDMDDYSHAPQTFNPDLPIPSIEQDVKPPKSEPKTTDTDTAMASTETTNDLAEIDAATYQPSGQLAATRNVLQAMGGFDMQSTQYDRNERSPAPVDLSEQRIAGYRKKAIPTGTRGRESKAVGGKERVGAHMSAPMGGSRVGLGGIGFGRGGAAERRPSEGTRRSKRLKEKHGVDEDGR